LEGAAATYDRGMAEDVPKTWILTGSLENFRINVERNFDVIGLKERRIRQAEQFMSDDRVIFYVTGVKAFGGIAKVLSPMFEDREPIWPQGKKKVHEDYPWRVQAEPLLVLDEADFVPAESLLGEMEHLAKWPAEHWTLAFQGQLRTISAADSELLEARMRASRNLTGSARS
jgi:predicted RNA-binding protein